MTTCWCGTKNAYFALVESECSGTGTVYCYCGGDFCVCHHHGEAECPGCAMCDTDEHEDDDDRGSAA